MLDGDARVGISLRTDRFVMRMAREMHDTYCVETAGVEGKRRAMDTSASPASY